MRRAVRSIPCRRSVVLAAGVCICLVSIAGGRPGPVGSPVAYAVDKLEVKPVDGGGFAVYRAGQDKPLLEYHAPPDGRPYVHPLVAPDGKGILTEFSPHHHKHQTGLYVGFTRINGRDYFHNRGSDYWKRTQLTMGKVDGNKASWSASYELLGNDKQPALAVTEQYTLTDLGNTYILDLDWSGKAAVDIVWAKYEYGGLFLRMPYKEKTGGEASNSEGKKNGACEGQRARWVNVGMPIEGRDDWGHIAILDHKENPEHPVPWRVDGQLGVGPARSRVGEWRLAKGETVRFRYRFLVQTGKVDPQKIEAAWQEWCK